VKTINSLSGKSKSILHKTNKFYASFFEKTKNGLDVEGVVCVRTPLYGLANHFSDFYLLVDYF